MLTLFSPSYCASMDVFVLVNIIIAILACSLLPHVKLLLLLALCFFSFLLSLKLLLVLALRGYSKNISVSWKRDNYKGSNKEKNPWPNVQNGYKWSKQVKSNNFCYHKSKRAITKWGIRSSREAWLLSTTLVILFPFSLPS